MINLDYKCMKYAQQIILNVEDPHLDNKIKRALGILREDGVYAMFLWLNKDENKDRNNKKKRNENRYDPVYLVLVDMLNEPEIKQKILGDAEDIPKDFGGFCVSLRNIAGDLDKLLFLKKLLERTLIYAFYHAKIGGDNVE